MVSHPCGICLLCEPSEDPLPPVEQDTLQNVRQFGCWIMVLPPEDASPEYQFSVGPRRDP